MDICIKANSRMDSRMDLADCISEVDVYMKEIGWKVINMEKVYYMDRIVFMMDILIMIEKMDQVY